MKRYENPARAAQFAVCLCHLAVESKNSIFGVHTAEWITKVNCGCLHSIND